MKRALAAFVVIASTTLGLGTTAMADQPGPGDKQCVPGQHGNPHPGHKAGAC